ncbi:MAG TPA: hypothetical protein PKH77_02695 [Anaerolineae bacterium]|nr:hypothetical protein [Anaerolineae bacterium]
MFDFGTGEDILIEEFQDDLVFNGVNGDTGTYGQAPMSAEKLARLIQGKPRPEDFPQKDPEFAANSALEMVAQGLDAGKRGRLLWALAAARLATGAALTDEQKAYLEAEIADLQARFPAALSADEQGALLRSAAEDLLAQDEDYEADDLRKLDKGQKKFLKELVDDAALTEAQQHTLLRFLIHLEENAETSGALKGKRAAPFPTKEGVDAARIEQAGWAILFPGRMSAKQKNAIKDALKPLLELRKAQAGPLYREFEGASGYRPDERLDQFFKHQNPEVKQGPADPAQMPFYVLLIGSPEEIPYSFQYQLDVMRAVGRLDFGEDYAAYAEYARNVVLAETGQVKLPRQTTFFGVANPGDKATQLSSKYLIRPLFDGLQDPAPAGEIKLEHEWKFDKFVEKDANHAQLGKLLGGDPKLTPALLLTASHGMEFSQKDPDKQRKYQGAILCQDWDGPSGKLERGDYFAGEDLPKDANLLGMVAMFFACYGGGTPKLDQFAMQAFKKREAIAPEGFVADLPKQMLRRGALAVIGHVERAWGYSFVTPNGNPDQQAFVTALRKLLNGDPVGLATDPSFNMRYADMSSNLSTVMEELHWDPNHIAAPELAQLWTANNDARSYVIIGDPAVRIPFAKGKDKPAVRPALDTTFDLDAYLKKEYNYVAGTGSSHAAAPTAGAAEMSAAQNFGLFDRKDKEGAPEGEAGKESGPLQAFQKIAADLAATIGAAVEEITSLEVNTYTSSDLEGVVYDAGEKRFKGQIRMRARTYISFDGDMEVCLPVREDGSVDRELWQIHSDTVKQAQINRTEFLKTVADLTARLVGK